MQVAQHFRFAAVGVEDRVVEKPGVPFERARDRHGAECGTAVRGVDLTEEGGQCVDAGVVRGFADRDAEAVVVESAKLDARCASPLLDIVGVRAVAEVDSQSVEDVAMAKPVAARLESTGESISQSLDRGRDFSEALGAVVDRVHRGEHSGQNLCRADVAGRLSRRMCCSRV